MAVMAGMLPSVNNNSGVMDVRDLSENGSLPLDIVAGAFILRDIVVNAQSQKFFASPVVKDKLARSSEYFNNIVDLETAESIMMQSVKVADDRTLHSEITSNLESNNAFTQKAIELCRKDKDLSVAFASKLQYQIAKRRIAKRSKSASTIMAIRESRPDMVLSDKVLVRGPTRLQDLKEMRDKMNEKDEAVISARVSATSSFDTNDYYSSQDGDSGDEESRRIARLERKRLKHGAANEVQADVTKKISTLAEAKNTVLETLTDKSEQLVSDNAKLVDPVASDDIPNNGGDDSSDASDYDPMQLDIGNDSFNNSKAPSIHSDQQANEGAVYQQSLSIVTSDHTKIPPVEPQNIQQTFATAQPVNMTVSAQNGIAGRQQMTTATPSIIHQASTVDPTVRNTITQFAKSLQDSTPSLIPTEPITSIALSENLPVQHIIAPLNHQQVQSQSQATVNMSDTRSDVQLVRHDINSSLTFAPSSSAHGDTAAPQNTNSRRASKSKQTVEAENPVINQTTVQLEMVPYDGGKAQQKLEKQEKKSLRRQKKLQKRLAREQKETLLTRPEAVSAQSTSMAIGYAGRPMDANNPAPFPFHPPTYHPYPPHQVMPSHPHALVATPYGYAAPHYPTHAHPSHPYGYDPYMPPAYYLPPSNLAPVSIPPHLEAPTRVLNPGETITVRDQHGNIFYARPVMSHAPPPALAHAPGVIPRYDPRDVHPY